MITHCLYHKAPHTLGLQVGSYELTLRFQYLLATDAVGFFKTFYRKPTGEKV